MSKEKRSYLKYLPTPLSGKDMLIIGGVFLFALALKLYTLRSAMSGMTIAADGVGYCNIARDFVREFSFQNATHFPPFYPILIGIMNLLVPDIELAGRLVSIIMGSLLVVPIYLLAVEFFDRKVGIMACLITVVWPSIYSWSAEVLSQATYITVNLMGIYFMWMAYKKRSVLLSAMAGFFMAMAYLTRGEAFIVFFAMTVTLFLCNYISGRPWKEWLFSVSIVWIAFFVLSFPYINLLHESTGKWQLTGKTKTGIYHSLGEYLGKVDLYNDPTLPDIGLLEVMMKYPDFVRFKLKTNLKQVWNEMVPLYIWLLSILGLVSGGWGRGKNMERLFLLSSFAPLIVLVLFFFTSREYVQPYLPVLFLWAGQGLLWGEESLRNVTGDWKQSRVREFFDALPIALIIVLVFSAWMTAQRLPSGEKRKPYHFSQDGARYDRKKIGYVLNEHLPKDAVIMTRWSRIGFYADRKSHTIPQASFPDILRYGREKGAQFLVVDGALMGIRPQLGVLFRPLRTGNRKVLKVAGENGAQPIPGLSLFLLYKDPASIGVAVYRIEG